MGVDGNLHHCEPVRFREAGVDPLTRSIVDGTCIGPAENAACFPSDFPRLFELGSRDELRIEAMAGPDFALEGVNDAFEALASDCAVRPRVVF